MADKQDIPGVESHMFLAFLEHQRRQDRLCRLFPKCPLCGEDKAIQLIGYLVVPAIWKCRKCKHRWVYEPPITD